MNKEILITYSNGETLNFSSLSTAKEWTLNMFFAEIFAVKLRANHSDFVALQNYIDELCKSKFHSKNIIRSKYGYHVWY